MTRTNPFHVLTASVVLLVASGASGETVHMAQQVSPDQTSAPAPAEPDPFVFPETGMASVQKLATDADRVITNYQPLVLVEGRVTLAAAPIEAGCVSSVFGPRKIGTHKGVDYFNREPVDIYAAGGGTVKEMTYRDDFGNMLVIDHGDGVFTRYAHLQEFSAALTEGSAVQPGEVIGVMGNTAGYTIARHLHYEVLTGEWGSEAGSFALTPVNVLALPATQAGS
jgi:murein DD-endopeptidase MepM/ murein hydrolase activator NlpD